MKRSSFLIFALCCPLVASAQVVFTEVMYDLEVGSDSGREWVEIQNTGSASVDVSGYRFREGETNHTLVLSAGNATLAPLGVAVIADNPSKFLTDNPSFSGTLFDSSFSLSNAGETLVLKDSNLVDLDQFVYSSEMGGNGDGKSLQSSASGWGAAAPTPGVVLGSQQSPSSSENSGTTTNSSSTDETSEENSSQSTSASSSAPSGSSSKWPVKPQIYPYAGDDKRVTVGTPAEFTGSALGLNKEPLVNARYLWNFGDGASAEGKNVLHTYHYPGSYVAVLDVSSGEFSNTDKLVVTVAAAELVLTSGLDSFGSFLEIENKSREEVDLSHWQLIAGGKIFYLPRGTLLLAGKKVRFPENITALPFASSAELRYPNGVHAISGGDTQREIAAPSVVSQIPTVVPARTKVVAAAALVKEPEPVPTSSSAPAVPLRASSVPATNYLWFYALGGLLGLSIAGVALLGRMRRQEIEIIEDNS